MSTMTRHECPPYNVLFYVDMGLSYRALVLDVDWKTVEFQFPAKLIYA